MLNAPRDLKHTARSLVHAMWLTLCLGFVQGCTTLPAETYTPRLGQVGKDVMWLPTRDELVTRLLKAAEVTPADEVVDLGAGDGKIPIAAALQFGARAWGIEYNKNLTALAQRNAQRAGVADRVHFVNGDIYTEDFSSATVVMMYLLEEINAQLRPTILAMRPGTRILSNTFSMGDWEPDQVIRANTSTGYFWTVPAAVNGAWSITGLDSRGPAILRLAQRYQRIGGSLAVGSEVQTLLGARLQGTDLYFSFVNTEGELKAVSAKVEGARLTGVVVGPYGMVESEPPVVKIAGERHSGMPAP